MGQAPGGLLCDHAADKLLPPNLGHDNCNFDSLLRLGGALRGWIHAALETNG